MSTIRRLGYVVCICGVPYSQSASAVSSTTSGTIQQVYTYGDGRVLVTGFSFPNMTCTNNGGFWIPGDHPHLKELLATILAARATGATIQVTAKVDSCWYPEITADPSSYIVVSP